MIVPVLIARVAGWLQCHQHQAIAYLLAENRARTAQRGGRRLGLTDTERRRLAMLAHPLGRQRLKEVATIATPDTLLRWDKRLIAQQVDGSTPRRQLGRPRVPEDIEPLVMRMAEEHATWGYRRLQGALANLGHPLDAITVRNILRRPHLEPAPHRRKTGMSWTQFLQTHWEVRAATDCCTVAVAPWHGLVTYYVLFGMEWATRRVQLAGITPHPPAACMPHCARQLPDPFDGFLLGKQSLLHDRDTQFTPACATLLQASGVEPIVFPPRSPHLNAHWERFVRASKEAALEPMVMLGERPLSQVIRPYLTPSHPERKHQGLGNVRSAPAPAHEAESGRVVHRDRLGGLRSYSDRDAA